MSTMEVVGRVGAESDKGEAETKRTERFVLAGRKLDLSRGHAAACSLDQGILPVQRKQMLEPEPEVVATGAVEVPEK